MKHQKEVKALVMYARNYREKDKLVKLFTQSNGKVMFFVKNANRKNNPITSAIQPFTLANFIVDLKSEGLSFINAVKEITPYENIQKDIFISAYATFILNITDAAIEDHIYDPALFGFVLEALDLLNKQYDPEIITNIFEVQLLNRFGITINWQKCVFCDEKKGKFDFSFSNHGIICEKHWPKDPRRSHFNSRGMHFVRLFSSIKYEQIKQINLKKETKEAVRIIIDQLYDEYVGIYFKSKKFIDDMKKWETVMKTDESSTNKQNQAFIDKTDDND